MYLKINSNNILIHKVYSYFHLKYFVVSNTSKIFSVKGFALKDSFTVLNT